MEKNTENRSDDFFLPGVLGSVVRYWWLLSILMIAGGVAGLLISRIQKPVYESTAHITTVIDYAYAGRLTDYEEDHILSMIGDIITSDSVLGSTAVQAEEQGLVKVGEHSLDGLTASRQGYRWVLNSRFHDPGIAQSINKIWLEKSIQALEIFRQDSINALSQFNAQSEVEACFQQAVSLEPVSPYCSLEQIRELLIDLEPETQDPQSGSLLSRLLASRLSYQVTREPDLPSTPVHFGTNITTLSGAIIGLLVAVILFVLGFPRSNQPEKKK